MVFLVHVSIDLLVFTEKKNFHQIEISDNRLVQSGNFDVATHKKARILPHLRFGLFLFKRRPCFLTKTT